MITIHHLFELKIPNVLSGGTLDMLILKDGSWMINREPGNWFSTRLLKPDALITISNPKNLNKVGGTSKATLMQSPKDLYTKDDVKERGTVDMESHITFKKGISVILKNFKGLNSLKSSQEYEFIMTTNNFDGIIRRLL
jgi:hypothetical protein